MRRIERLINLIAALLETTRPLPAEEIRDRVSGYESENVEAFRRKFERDKADLRAAGIPIELRTIDALSDTEGYLIPKERYYLPELDLEPDEVAALKLAAGSMMGTGDEALAGLMKVALDDPGATWTTGNARWGADLTAEQPHLPVLFSAVVERRRVTFAYGGGTSEGATRLVEPYALAHRRGRWYVVGRDAERDAIRSFRLDRIQEPIATFEEGFGLPDDFRADDHLVAEPWEIGDAESQTATVRFDSSMRWWAEQHLEGTTVSEGPGGSVDVELAVSNLDALVSWVLGFAPAVEVVAPEDARRAVADHAAAVSEIL
ncbi:MAG TPA: WYL domain-containing protein [Actinomycetota bacterium]|nr:WYL domain-containing protein [Actinomycetota bacterium]